MKKLIIILVFVIFCCIVLVVGHIVFDAKELSVEIIPNELDALYINVNKDGIVGYWVGYNLNSNDFLDIDSLIPKENETESLHSILYNTDDEHIYATRRLTMTERKCLNKLTCDVIKSDAENQLEYSDGLTIFIKINGTKYQALLIHDNISVPNDRDIAMNNLMYMLWGLRPTEIDNYFTNINRYPKYMFDINIDNYDTYFR